jgi:Sugar (and other) transporter
MTTAKVLHQPKVRIPTLMFPCIQCRLQYRHVQMMMLTSTKPHLILHTLYCRMSHNHLPHHGRTLSSRQGEELDLLVCDCIIVILSSRKSKSNHSHCNRTYNAQFPFYGLGLSAPAISRNIWHKLKPKRQERLPEPTRQHNAVSRVLSNDTMVGSLLIIKVIKYWSSKVIQFYAFVVLGILFLTIGGAFTKILDSNYKGIIIVLYVLAQLAFNLGPNTTTFIIPTEIFPSRYRCTCHGLSAAAGKLRSIIGQVFIAYVRFRERIPMIRDHWVGS